MTANNLEKWVWAARVLRHITDACFGITAIIMAATSAIVLSSIKFMAITEESAILMGSFIGYVAAIIGYMFIAAGWYAIFFCSKIIISGKRDYFFGQKRSRELAYRITGDYKLPSDAIKKRSNVTIRLEILVAVAGSICFLVRYIIDVIAPEAVSGFITVIFYVNFVAMIITVMVCAALAIYLKIAKTQLEFQLGLRRSKRKRYARL